MKNAREAVCVVITMLVLGAAHTPAARGDVPKCAGKATDQDSSSNKEVWLLECSGNCDGNACPSYTTTGSSSEWSETNGTDSMGDFWQCLCEGESESNCCHFILRKGDSDRKHEPDTDGACSNCGAGTCTLIEDEDERRADCPTGGVPPQGS